MSALETLKRDYEVALQKLEEATTKSYSTYRRCMRAAVELKTAIKRFEEKEN